MSNLIIISFILNISFSWEMTLYISDIEDVAGNDYLTLGTCEECHDGFHYGEDVYDIPTGVTTYTDIQFFNLEWIGSIDSNGNECEFPEFALDKKSTHPPSDLLKWKIRGAAVGHSSPLELTWEMDDLSDEYEIYLYIGDQGYNLKVLESINLNPSDLPAVYEWIDINQDGIEQFDEWFSDDNVKILIGGCASTGTELYYIDEDQDGWGTGMGYDFCPGLEPNGYVNNNLDFNDTITCVSNNFDDCSVCDGGNTDMDCAGTCFGNAEIDDCGACGGGNTDMDCAGTCFGNAEIDDCGACDNNNQSCLDEIFEYLPYNLHALIEDNSILISWDFDINLEDSFIEGFHLYSGEINPINISITQELYFQTTEFNDGYFCVSAFDRFNNESDIICTEATEYYSLSYNLHEGANLLSFPYIPQDNSVDNIFYSIKNQLDGIIGEGIAAYYEESLDTFIGSMDHIYYEDGYWVKIKTDLDDDNINFNVLGFPYQGNTILHQLHEGYNLISYLEENNLSIETAIPDEFSDNIISIIGEGTASLYSQGQWIGNLDYLEHGSAYWVKSNSNNILFYWNNP